MTAGFRTCADTLTECERQAREICDAFFAGQPYTLDDWSATPGTWAMGDATPRLWNVDWTATPAPPATPQNGGA